MKLSVSNIAWDAKDNYDILTFLQKKDIRHIEIAPSIPFSNLLETKKTEVESYRHYLNNFNVSCVSFQSLFYPFPDINIFHQPEEAIDKLDSIIQVAAHLGCKNLVFGSPKNRNTEGLTSLEIEENSIAFFTQLGDVSKNYDVTIALEANPTIYNCNFLTSTLEVIDFLKILDHSHVKLNLDLGTITVNNESVETIFNQGKYFINHVHLSEPYLAEFQNFDLAERVIRHLKEMEYSNFISLEMRKSTNESLKSILSKLVEVVS